MSINKAAKIWIAIVTLCTYLSLMAPAAPGEERRPVTARDCALVRDTVVDGTSWKSTTEISPDGRNVAYRVKSPNLATNTNDIELHVRNLSGGAHGSDRIVLLGQITEAHWTSDSRHLLALMKANSKHSIFVVDVTTGERKLLFEAHGDIVEYSTDAAVRTIVYSTEIPEQGRRHPAEDVARGYRIDFPETAETSWPRRRVFVVRRQGTRSSTPWSAPQEMHALSPLSGQSLSGFNHGAGNGLNLSVAPDGSAVLISYFDFSAVMPPPWQSSEYMKLRERSGMIDGFLLLARYDLATGRATIPFPTPWVVSKPVWSADSHFVLVAAMAPIGSEQELQDARSGDLGHAHTARLYRVELSNGHSEIVADHLAFAWEGALAWPRNDEVLVRTAATNSIADVARVNGTWRSTRIIELPRQGNLNLTTNGRIVVGSFSDAATAPELFSYEPTLRKWSVLARFNPQLDVLAFASSRDVYWQTSTGYKVAGVLLLPPDFDPGKRYPLVIQTKPFARAFTCSFGDFPSFAPEPIADAGILYLGILGPEDPRQREQDFYPEGFPGGKGTGTIAEAAFNMDLWDSAIDSLDHQGLVDRNRVGIIGFSRTGWYTEFSLAHGRTHYAAATVADNMQYSLGEYWLHHDVETLNEFNRLYGAPPYGAARRNWLDYSVSFNLDKIHAPLLMEEMGNGVAYENPNMLPIDLAAAFEVFAGLHVLGRPVEMYYYPNESHTPENPAARLATMQRNVDWYRFWLEGYERKSPEDKDQYPRWRAMRSSLQDKRR